MSRCNGSQVKIDSETLATMPLPKLLVSLKNNIPSIQAKMESMEKIIENKDPNYKKRIEMLLKYRTPISGKSLYIAALNDNLSIINLINNVTVTHDAKQQGLNGAAISGRLNMIELFITPQTNFNDALIFAVKGNQLDCCEYLINCGAYNFNDALAISADNTSKEIIRLLIVSGATIWDYRLSHDDVMYLFSSCKIPRYLFMDNHRVYEKWIADWEKMAVEIMIEYDNNGFKYSLPNVIANLILQFVDTQPVYYKSKKLA